MYKHLTIKFFVSLSSPSNAKGNAVKCGSVGATMKKIRHFKYSQTFPMEKPFNYMALKLTS